jgi:hypothetical protein
MYRCVAGVTRGMHIASSRGCFRLRMQCELGNHLMTTSASASNRASIGPYSRMIDRGSLGHGISGRSREGKFLRRVEKELVAQVGGAPSFAQRLLVRRIARAVLRLELLDEKMAAGNWTDGDARTFGGLSNALRLMLRELGLKAVPQTTPSLQDYITQKTAAKAAAGPR